jgi:phospholipid-binding lipoprotein MlaA
MKMKSITIESLIKTCCLGLLILLGGCASDEVKRDDPRDPLEGWNRGAQKFNDGLDDYLFKPIGKGYKTVTPNIIDKGVTNFYSNVSDVGVIANDLLQFKLLQTGQDFGRLMVNTTIGMVGFVDVASKMNLPKHDEDFDQTLGKWGIPSGPYLVLPVIGPGSPRGLVGYAGDLFSNPINYITPMAVPYASGSLRIVDQRADLLSASKIMDEASVDRYEFIRNAYQQQRTYLINDGNPPPDEELEKQMDLDLQGVDGDPKTTTK